MYQREGEPLLGDHVAKKRKGHRRTQSDSQALLVGASVGMPGFIMSGPKSSVDDWNVASSHTAPKPRTRKKKAPPPQSKPDLMPKVDTEASGPLDKRSRRKPSAKAKLLQQMQEEEEAEQVSNVLFAHLQVA